MVKNTHGGSGQKKFGRKFTNTSGAGGKLRTSDCDFEKYAIVTKMCGNNNIHVYCLDDNLRLCHIRGKFSGRRKRDNVVSIGTWVLVGVREYDDCTTTKKKLRECDLLEVYTNVENEQLKNNVDEDWDILTSHDTSILNKEDADTKHKEDAHFCFSTEHEDHLEYINAVIAAPKVEMIGEEKEEVNVDCI